MVKVASLADTPSGGTHAKNALLRLSESYVSLINQAGVWLLIH